MNKNQKLIAGAAAAGAFGLLYATNAFKIRWHIPREYYKYKYKAEEAVKHECETLFIGDSITWLYKLGKHYPGKDYLNRGISGDRTSHILSRCVHTFENIRAQKIVLLGGINDLSDNKSPYEILVNLFKIIETAGRFNPGAEIFVESIYPVNNNGANKRHDTCTDGILEINSVLKEKASELGYTYIDMFSVLVTGDNALKEEYTYDGLHPNEEGFRAITQELNKYI